MRRDQVPALITVLVPTYNRQDFLAECLDSLLGQTLPPAQIVVVNDGSSDRTLQVLQPYRDRIDYVESPQLGRPGAINRGLKVVRGEFLWIFDDDDVALPDALERFVEPFGREPHLGYTFSTFYYAHSAADRRIGDANRVSQIPDLEERGPLLPLLEANYLCGAGLFARTSCYAVVGDFNEALIRSQDYEMAIRIARTFQGKPVRGGATFHYRQHDGARGSSTDRFGAELQRQKWLEYDQHFFRGLHRDLPLEAYLPPGASLLRQERQARLQRSAVMALKLLIPEVVEDLRGLAALGDDRPFTSAERRIVRSSLARPPYYGAGAVIDAPEVQHLVRVLARSSRTMRQLRGELGIAVFRQSLHRKPWTAAPKPVADSFRRIAPFYLPTPTWLRARPPSVPDASLHSRLPRPAPGAPTSGFETRVPAVH